MKNTNSTPERKKSERERLGMPVSFINSRALTTLTTILLILLIILVFTQVAYVFQPIWLFIRFVSFPIIGSGILYYLFSPIVERVSEMGVSRHIPIIGIFILLILLIVWGIFSLYPVLAKQAEAFLANMPEYNSRLNEMLGDLPFNVEKALSQEPLSRFVSRINWNNITNNLQNLVTSTFGGLSTFIGSVTQIAVGLVTIPVILYYLLLEGEKLPYNILRLVPPRIEPYVERVLLQANYYISQFVRSIITLAVLVGIFFWISYKIIGLDYALSLAFLSGLLNLVPYIGSIVSVIPALIIALLTSPMMFVKVIIVLMIEQLVESRLLQPFIIGGSLSIHPLTILFLILGAGRVFGVTGVLLVVPIYAVVKVIVKEIYYAFRRYSKLYPDN